MSSLPVNEVFDPIFEKRNLIEALKVIWFVIKNIIVSFDISSGSYNLPQNTLRLIHEFERCILSLMESLIADFLKLFSSIAKFLSLQGRLGTRLRVLAISWFY